MHRPSRVLLAVIAITSVAQFTIGIMLASGSSSLSALLRVPLLWALLPALAFLVSGTAPPDWIIATTRLIGDMTIPLMLLTLGVSLASLKVRDLATATVYGGLRVLVGFAIGLALASFLGLQGAERGVLLIQASMPSAVFTYLMAEHYQRSPQTVAGIIVMSTLVAFVCLPLVVWLATGSGGPA